MEKTDIIKKYFNQQLKLTLKNPQYLKQVKMFTSFLLEEDLQDKGDITTDLLIKNNQEVTAIIRAKEDGIVAGIKETNWFLASYKLQVTSYKKDGDHVKKDNTILKINGDVRDILKVERTILNLLQRMSGIATQTSKLVKLTHNKVLIVPTRKTQWGLLDKKAVTLGGGGTHRLGLYDWVLIKDNHLKFYNIQYPISNIFSFWEIEAKTEKQVEEFLKLKPDAIMFDNFKPKNIEKILKKYKKNITDNIIFEASGGITEKNIVEYVKTGVDVISLGSLTHSSKALDISLDIE